MENRSLTGHRREREGDRTVLLVEEAKAELSRERSRRGTFRFPEGLGSSEIRPGSDRNWTDRETIWSGPERNWTGPNISKLIFRKVIALTRSPTKNNCEIENPKEHLRGYGKEQNACTIRIKTYHLITQIYGSYSVKQFLLWAKTR